MENDKVNATPAKKDVTHAPPTVTAVSQMYQGPIPLASELAGYEQVCKGSADRIIAMAERQSAHRQDIEKMIVKGRTRDSLLGIIAAMLLSFFILVAGVFCILAGHDWAGSTIITIDIVGLCTVFIYGTSLKNKQDSKIRRNQ